MKTIKAAAARKLAMPTVKANREKIYRATLHALMRHGRVRLMALAPNFSSAVRMHAVISI
jgi:hypothetical protein